YIKGISPAISIKQKTNTNNPKSTVGTSSEIYDLIRILFSRFGKFHFSDSKEEIKKNSTKDVIKYISKLKKNQKFLICYPTKNISKAIEIGLKRCIHNDSIKNISEINLKEKEINIVVDRQILNDIKLIKNNIIESSELAFELGDGVCEIRNENGKLLKRFTNFLEYNSNRIEEPIPNTFNFNSPYGACETCHGYGDILGIDEDKVIPNKNLSITENAIVPWSFPSTIKWKRKLINESENIGINVKTPYSKLSKDEVLKLWNGVGKFKGINQFFNRIEEKSYKIQYRVMLSRYRGRTSCPDCKGTRLKKIVNDIKFKNLNINEVVNMPIRLLEKFINNISLSAEEKIVGDKILFQIKSRLKLLTDLGLSYLSLSRKSSTLSGGESQRINIAKSIGSGLVDTLYILDEPSIGLHNTDTKKLINILFQLKDLGNTIIVIEHDLDIIKAADYTIDLGITGGENGGHIIFTGSLNSKVKSDSLTKKYFLKELKIEIPKKRRKKIGELWINNVTKNNLKNLKLKFPLGILTTISGVSGSGKSTLLRDVLYPRIQNLLKNKIIENIGGDTNIFKNIEFVKQGSIGKTSRSNLITYLKGFDEIRKLYAKLKYSKLNNLTPKHFSFNTDGGRCETCKGDGHILIDMQFMSDIKVKCEDCEGKRYKEIVLNAYFNKKNIYDLLNMTIDELYEFLSKFNERKIIKYLDPLKKVGLGYIKAGQTLSTLSGGELQRLKLASFINSNLENSILIFDEPTTGLHIHDIKKLLASFNEILKNNNTIIVIEHNMEIIKSSDWIIELGPEGGKNGGKIIFEGTPEDMNKVNTNTSKELKVYLK
ncbi:MAG: excinuclease ABC subunit A, partial [Flavobacteriales bacterium]|nr:excinuclease ABC subunit A [Flavobacteriales bacterium]